MSRFRFVSFFHSRQPLICVVWSDLRRGQRHNIRHRKQRIVPSKRSKVATNVTNYPEKWVVHAPE